MTACSFNSKRSGREERTQDNCFSSRAPSDQIHCFFHLFLSIFTFNSLGQRKRDLEEEHPKSNQVLSRSYIHLLRKSTSNPVCPPLSCRHGQPANIQIIFFLLKRWQAGMFPAWGCLSIQGRSINDLFVVHLSEKFFLSIMWLLESNSKPNLKWEWNTMCSAHH